MEVRDRLRLERDASLHAFAGAHHEHAVDEVEGEVEGAIAVRDERRGQSARVHVQGHVPRMVEPRRLHQADLADDLRPQTQRHVVAPDRQRRVRWLGELDIL